jgi:GT2 family glycosyltransferase
MPISNKLMVSLIICTYNNEDIISECLDSIQKQSYKGFETIVVDDNSKDTTRELILRNYPEIKLVAKKKNTGPSISRNIGAQKAKGDFLVFMDSDVILDKDWLQKQIAFMEKHPDIGICGSLLVYKYDATIVNSAGGWISKTGFSSDFGRDKRLADQFRISRKVPFVCSAACIVRKDAFHAADGFDEDYFYPHEDTDLCWKMLVLGYGVYYNGDVLAVHSCGHTVRHMSDRVAFHVTKNRIVSMLKNYSFSNVLLYVPLHTFIMLIYSLKSPRMPKIKGLIWVLKNWNYVMKKRKIIQSKRRRSDYEITQLFSNRLF